MPEGESSDPWLALARARQRVAELEAGLKADTRSINPPTAGLRKALASVGVGMWEWNVLSGAVRWSDGVEQLFGLNPGEFDGTLDGYLALLCEDARRTVLGAVEDALRGGDEFSVEHAVHPRGQAPKWVLARGQVFRDDEGAPVSISGVVADVSLRKQSQDQLSESEERFKAFAHSSFEGIAFSANGVAVDVNDNLCAMLGRRPEEIVGRSFVDFIHPDDFRLVRRGLERGESSTYRVRVFAKDGSLIHVELRGRDVTYRGATARMTSVRDVTEEVRLTEERDRISKQLFAAQKLEAVGQLAGGIAHDFNNIMMVMLGNLGIAISDLEQDGSQSEVVEGLREAVLSGSRAVSLIAQLLAYSRKQPHHPKQLSLAAVLGQVVGMLRPALAENIVIDQALAADVPDVFMDPSQLQQVLMNLALNARDAMPNGGRLTLGAGRLCLQSWTPPQPTDLEGNFVRLWVSDDGTGMHPHVQARIFEPFFTTKGPGDGTGLGLSTTYGIVQQAGGAIFVESALGQGSTFSLLLPGSEDALKSRAGASRPSQDAAAAATILVCEDNAGVRRFIARVLRAAAYDVLQAESAAQALDQALLAARLDLLITDMVLPDGDGSALAERLLEVHPRMAVLLASGYADAARPDGDDAPQVLAKPFSGEELLGRIKRLLNR